jgi:hypothetical protein
MSRQRWEGRVCHRGDVGDGEDARRDSGDKSRIGVSSGSICFTSATKGTTYLLYADRGVPIRH